MDKTRLFLLDGTNYAYRAFYALGDLSNSHGFPTNAIYGFAKMLFKFLRDCQPTHVAVVFDRGGPTIRHEIYDQYKATRKATPEALLPQLDAIREFVTKLGMAVIEQRGVEADDIIGSLTRRHACDGREVVIISGDKDFTQLVDDGVSLWDTMKDVRYNASKVKELLGVEPCFIVDLLALMGDATDNIPGVPGIGKKGAAALIERFGHIENILANIERIPQARVKENLRHNVETLRLSYDLARIRTEVPIAYEFDDLRLREADREGVITLLKLYEFGSLLQEFRREQNDEANSYLLVGSDVGAADAADDIRRGGVFAAVLAVFSHGEGKEESLLGVAVSTPLAKSYFIPLAVIVGDGAAIRRLFADANVGKIVHDFKGMKKSLAEIDFRWGGVVMDTQLAAYLLNASLRTYDLATVVLEHLGSAVSLATAPDEKTAIKNSVLCARTLWELHGVITGKLHADGLFRLLTDVELPLAAVLYGMENRGILVEKNLLYEMSKEMALALDIQERKIYAFAGERFNINSPKQLQTILFEKLRLPKGRKTKDGYSTDSDVLNDLARRHELPAEILAYRRVAKLKSTYIDALPLMINPQTCRIHTTFNQTGTATGRISSNNPNLQNIPIRTEEGRRIRRAFIPPEKWKIVSADYSQIELRILAHFSRDKLLHEAFLQGEDIHTNTAITLFNTFPSMVTADMRRYAKAINFGVIYGMSAFGLARELGVDHKTAQNYIDDYFRKYGGIREYLDATVAQAREDGFVKTIMERRRYLPEITSYNAHLRQFAERMAVNTTIQGSAADIIKVAMLRIDAGLLALQSPAKMILQVHDELVFECPASEVSSLQDLAKREMENVVELSVPLVANVSCGDNWGDAH